MKKSEYQTIKEIIAKVKLVNRKELLEIILNVNPKRNPKDLRFYIFDLVTNNIIYRLNENSYKYNGDLAQFSYQYTNIEKPLKTRIEKKYESVKVCLWNTTFLSSFLNLLPVVNYTFIEIETNLAKYLYNDIKDDYSVLFDPSNKEIELYGKGKDRIIVRKIIARAPVEQPYPYTLAANKYIKSEKSSIYKPTIEKILVDIFIDTKKYGVFNDLDELYKGILKTYCVNFQKLFAYSKYRGIFNELSVFINERIKFDTKIGEFT